MDLFTTENAIALLTLTALEIVLGVDNVIFISVLVAKLKPSQRDMARRMGLIVAMLSRLLLLFTLSWIMLLKEPLFSIDLLGKGFSGRDLILLFGGLFLMGKATHEMHDEMEGAAEEAEYLGKRRSFTSTLIQIVFLDIIFSLDSVITAVGMVDQLSIMCTAVIISVIVMMLFSKAIGEFIDRRPTFKILALSFLLLVGMMLMLEGLGKHVEKAYIYFAMGFSLFVEFINCKIRDKHAAALKAQT